VGTALQRRLAGLPNEVRPVGRADDLSRAFDGVAAVVHLAGTLRPRRGDSYQSANLATVEATLAAANRSGAQRLVFLSYLDADPASANPYLRAKGQAEQLVRRSRLPSVVFRAAHLYGDREAPGPTAQSMLSRAGRPVAVLGSGRQRYSWLARIDAVEAIVRAALDPSTPTGTFLLAGPRPLGVDEFVRHINPPGTRIRHLPAPAARLLGRLLPSLSGPLVDVMLRDCVPPAGTPETAERFGLDLHELGDVWPVPTTT
jgi:NADH dehydrogenase